MNDKDKNRLEELKENLGVDKTSPNSSIMYNELIELEKKEMLNPDKLFVVHYDSSIILLTDKYPLAELKMDEEKKKWPALNWRISTLTDFGSECWSDGHSSAEEDMAENQSMETSK